jgi:hypothetical protein
LILNKRYWLIILAGVVSIGIIIFALLAGDWGDPAALVTEPSVIDEPASDVPRTVEPDDDASASSGDIGAEPVVAPEVMLDEGSEQYLEQPGDPAPTGVQSLATTSGGDWPYVIALIALLLALAAVASTFILLRWRKALEGGQTSILPNQVLGDWGKVQEVINGQSQYLQKLGEFIQEQIRQAQSQQEGTREDVRAVMESLRLFQDELSKKDAEIERLRTGADARIFIQFLGRFLRVLKVLEEEALMLENRGQDASSLRGYADLLESALEECGVERFSPVVGDEYTTADGVADRPETTPTDDPKKHLRIAHVIRNGFLLPTDAKPVYVQKAEVCVYQHQATGGQA